MFKWESYEGADLRCCISGCTRPARHLWTQDFPPGDPVPYCCEHFGAIIVDIFNSRDAIYARAMQNALMELDKRIRSIAGLHIRMDAAAEKLKKDLEKK